MNIKILNKEETGRVRYVALDVEVNDGNKTYELQVTVAETYDSNSDSYDSDIDIVNFKDIPTVDDAEMIDTLIEEYINREGL